MEDEVQALLSLVDKLQPALADPLQSAFGTQTGACSKWPQLCIVTKLMAGGSVEGVLESRSGLRVATAIKFLRDAARGMDFLHKRGIIPRNLKAANLLIFIDESDVVKICDFGAARLKPT